MTDLKNLEEAERRLRNWRSTSDIFAAADAIRDHLAVCGKHQGMTCEEAEREIAARGKHDGCVSAEKVREVIANLKRLIYVYKDEAGDFYDGCRGARSQVVDDLRALLPPEPSALDQVEREMVEYRNRADGDIVAFLRDLKPNLEAWIALLRRAKEER